jgi:hypothetical protein
MNKWAGWKAVFTDNEFDLLKLIEEGWSLLYIEESKNNRRYYLSREIYEVGQPPHPYSLQP